LNKHYVLQSVQKGSLQQLCKAESKSKVRNITKFDDPQVEQMLHFLVSMSNKLANGNYKSYTPLGGKHFVGPRKGQCLGNHMHPTLFTSGVKEKLLKVAKRTKELLMVR